MRVPQDRGFQYENGLKNWMIWGNDPYFRNLPSMYYL